MFERSLNIMKEKDIIVEKGLSSEEISTIEKEYNLVFPVQLKTFLSLVLPVSIGYYNWRDVSLENINKIKKAIDAPLHDIYQEKNYIDWNPKWGEEPESLLDRYQRINDIIYQAPRLIPFCGHRFIPSGNYHRCPILSIYGSDIIYYGSDIDEFFEIEYGYKKQNMINFNDIDYVPVWSDLM